LQLLALQQTQTTQRVARLCPHVDIFAVGIKAFEQVGS
jgi:hypothetical protein